MRALAFLLAVAIPRVADACAPAPPHGAEVLVAAEEAIIVWDAAKKTEHFIRRAQFESTAKDFGFLVPTPGVPALAAADNSAFARLRDATKEEIRHETELDPEFSCLSALMLRSGTKAGAPPEVRVVSIQNVSGYEAAILQADDAEKLRGWLGAHGYDARPELTAWMAPYVANKWTITAFKVVGTATSSVRMTFTTDAPVFPYREPADQRTKSASERVLRVFLVASERYAGAIGNGGAWPGQLRYARPTALPALLAGALPADLIPERAWLHDFVDRSTPRPGTDDLFFARAADQGEVIPPPHVERLYRRVLIPLDLAAIIGVAAYFVVRAKRGRR